MIILARTGEAADLRKRRGFTTVVAVFVAVAAAGYYFFGANPILNHITQGLDLKGGLYVVFQAEPTPSSPVTPQVMQEVVKVMNFRVDALGVTQPQIQQAGTNQVIVQLPGVKNADQALKTIGQTGLLEFRKSDGKTVITTGADLVHAQAQLGSGNDPEVALQFNSAGAKAIAAYTSANVGKTMPIYLDKKLIESPSIRSAIPNGQGVITNMGTLTQAQALAVELNSGALPVSLKVVEDQTVGPTLGANSIARSKAAAAIAILFIAAFMMTLYRIPGFWAVFALAVYGMLLLGVLVAINATLTLPGITGLILSVGVAVDSNVIIFERIKEELRAGRTLRSAIDEGFRNGLRAVYDSNATTVIAAAVLFWLGTGPIRGFAVTVGIGVIISLITAVTFTKFILAKLVDAGAQPSMWFFARRGTPAAAVAGAGGGGMRAGGATGAGSVVRAGGATGAGNMARAGGAAAGAAGGGPGSDAGEDAGADGVAVSGAAGGAGRRRSAPSRSGFTFRSVESVPAGQAGAAARGAGDPRARAGQAGAGEAYARGEDEAEASDAAEASDVEEAAGGGALAVGAGTRPGAGKPGGRGGAAGTSGAHGAPGASGTPGASGASGGEGGLRNAAGGRSGASAGAGDGSAGGAGGSGSSAGAGGGSSAGGGQRKGHRGGGKARGKKGGGSGKRRGRPGGRS